MFQAKFVEKMEAHIACSITYEKKTNRCHYFNFIPISTDLYMFRAYRPIFRRIHTAVPTTIGSVAVPFGPRDLYVVDGLGDR
jgi:hypothetical protein